MLHHRLFASSIYPQPPKTRNSFLLLRSLNDQVYSQPIFDPMLIQRVSILQDLPSKDQNQLILFGFKPPGNLFFELKSKQSVFQAKDPDQELKAAVIAFTNKQHEELPLLQHPKRSPQRYQFSHRLLRMSKG